MVLYFFHYIIGLFQQFVAPFLQQRKDAFHLFQAPFYLPLGGGITQRVHRLGDLVEVARGVDEEVPVFKQLIEQLGVEVLDLLDTPVVVQHLAEELHLAPTSAPPVALTEEGRLLGREVEVEGDVLRLDFFTWSCHVFPILALAEERAGSAPTKFFLRKICKMSKRS